MIRRFPWRTLFLGALCLVPAGCEPHKSWLRPKDDDDMKAIANGAMEDDSTPRKVLGGSPDDANASSFFKSNRRAGGWSSEAQEIESHLGAN